MIDTLITMYNWTQSLTYLCIWIGQFLHVEPLNCFACRPNFQLETNVGYYKLIMRSNISIWANCGIRYTFSLFAEDNYYDRLCCESAHLVTPRVHYLSALACNNYA